jgi:opacity protein-like surface antigen
VQAVGNWNWLATVAARLGLAWDRALFYGKVGYGWSKTSVDLQTAAGDTICCGWSNTNSGLLLGAGIEYAFANNWTAKIEYNFLDLQKRTATVDGLNVVTADPQVHMVKAGINFKFGGGAY